MLGGGVGQRLRQATQARPGSWAVRLPGGPRPWLAGAGVALVALIAVIAWAWWPEGDPDPRARVYTDATACLLTGSTGINDPQAANVWAGMQEASLATRGKVQYLEVDGPQTSQQASTFLATLAGSKCDLVLTVGNAQNDALSASAPSYPKIRFVLVGTGKAQNNVSVVDQTGPDAVREEVRAKVAEVLGDAPSD